MKTLTRKNRRRTNTNVALDPALKERTKAWCDRNGWQMNTLIASLLEIHLDTLDWPKAPPYPKPRNPRRPGPIAAE